MLRITSEALGEVETLVLEGRLVGPWIEVLRRQIDHRSDPVLRIELDLSGLRFAEPAGAALLRELVERGWQVRRSSHFVEQLLRGEES